jgi:NAD(P)-dependent dehydrogenase (short-subunit alcohol dehydrogenase family)
MATVVQCDVSDEPADLATVDALARAYLNARRGGDRIVVLNASRQLLGLIELIGLRDLLSPP